MFWTVLLLLLLSGPKATAFSPSLSLRRSRTSCHLPSSFFVVARRAASSSKASSSPRVLHAETTSSSSTSASTSSTSTAATADNDDKNDSADNEDDSILQSLTPELARMTTAFQAIGDDKLRYKQLLYMANQLPSMDKSSMIPQNKVPGCLSTVYIDGTVKIVQDDDEHNNKEKKKKMLIEFTGDSDGLLTKGLVALLVRGLSGNTAAQIQRIDPQFIARAGISASLTPGRNNGFLNMLAVMKRRALQLEQEQEEQEQEQEQEALASATDKTSATADSASASATTTTASSSSSSSSTPMYDAMMEQLQKLQPTKLILTNVSHQHAGHAGMKGSSNTQESHFELDIVADAFDGLNLVKRHQLVYMMLRDVMPQIHALQIRAKTPAEGVLQDNSQQ
jgi:sulfur transfer protein SufE/stress-induced morphogen